MQNIVKNTVSVEDIIADIKSELIKQNGSWKNIGVALDVADSQYGSDSDGYKRILKATAISASKARKLIAVARDKRLQDAPEVLSAVHSWTTLYEVTTLNDDQFAKLISEAEACDRSPVVTPSLVTKIKRGDDVIAVDPYKPAFVIRIDENALKAGEFDGNDYERLMTLIQQIQETVRFVRVDDTQKIDKTERSYFDAIENEAKKVRRTMLEDALKAYKSQSSAWKRWNALSKMQKSVQQSPPIENWSDKNELLIHFAEKPEEVFAALGYDAYSNNATYETAQSNLSKKQEKFRVKMSDPYAHSDRFDSVISAKQALEDAEGGCVDDFLSDMKDAA